MSIANKKRTLFAGFLSIATIVILASCANDTDSSSSKAGDADTSKVVATDSATQNTAATAAATKKRKGKASVMFNTDNALKIEKDKDGVYSKAEHMPEYPGGEKALSNFVENNIMQNFFELYV